MPNPIDNPELYRGILLGGAAGILSPGKVTLSGHDDETEWDVKVGSATSGGTTTRKGDKPAVWTASFFLATKEEIEAWPAFLALVRTTVSGKEPKGLDVYHPDLAENRITSVLKGTISGVVHDGKGGQTRAIKFVSNKLPKKSGGTTKASTNKVDPNQDLKDKLAAATKQWQETPSG